MCLIWETRADADRFSIREVVAHLADWEDIWQERFERTVTETVPLLLRPNLTRRAAERGYATAAPPTSLHRFAQKRLALVAWLTTPTGANRDRASSLDRMGEVSLTGLVALALAHDIYHVRQVAESLTRLR